MYIALIVALVWGDRSNGLHCTASLVLSLPLQRIAYCKTKSDAVAKADGTFVERKKKKPEEGGH